VFIHNSRQLVLPAYKAKKAIGAFNAHNLIVFEAILRAAKKTKSPVIIQVTPLTLKYIPLPYFRYLAEAASKIYKEIPFSLHLDHGNSPQLVIDCLENGFGSVMIDSCHLPLEENIRITKKIVRVAKRFRAAVEAEIGQLTHSGEKIKKKDLTSPEEAKEFVERTKIDFLAVSVGTQHGMKKQSGEEHIVFDQLEKIYTKVKIPLVLHGASGVGKDELIKAKHYGIAKVNFDTAIRKIFTHALKKFLTAYPSEDDLRLYLAEAGKGVESLVVEKIKVLSS